MSARYLPSLVVALAFLSIVSAADPNQLQDFCVAINSTKDGVFVNGKFCKDPKLALPDDFFITGIQRPRNTSNQFGSHVTIFNPDSLPGLNTLGVSIARVDYGPYGVNPPHLHPRASEVLTVLEGTLYAGFVTSNPDHRLFSKILHRGDAFVFPLGLIHFQRNLGSTPAVASVTFSGQNSGVSSVANTIFGSNPPISVDLLSRAFQLDKQTVKELQGKDWSNNTEENETT